ncbi:MAG TPA: hypothetical protein VFB72_01235 [Verrucomicrobiae bacterium]|nr:hypothetical protein [Verrucomicrobiae bacterium]
MKYKIMKQVTFKKSYIALLLAFCATCNAAGTNKITGAFGKKLGETFTTNKVERIEMGKNEPLFKFTPTESHEYFSDYYVQITPISKIIYHIAATSPKDDDFDRVTLRYEALTKALSDKYGPAETVLGASTISQDFRSVRVKIVQGQVYPQLVIDYVDSVLAKIAEEERAEIEKRLRDKQIDAELKNKNNSGL